MKMMITTRQVGDVTIVDIQGRLVVGEESDAVRRQIRELVRQGNKKASFESWPGRLHRQPGIGRPGGRLFDRAAARGRAETARR